MFVMLLIGFTALILAMQAGRPPPAPRERPVEGWVGGAANAQTVESSESSAPVPTSMPSAQPPAPLAEPVQAEPALAGEGQARVTNTAGRG
jgi:hypothetical protein